MSGKYIVIFKNNVSQDRVNKYATDVTENGGSVTNRYDSVMKGFAATIPDQYLTTLQSLQGGDEIDYIEPDSTVTTQ
ncbi:protease propeptide/inhibitor [Gautieria morchelliformis]|nr:protease propeptide/inhibitor [Gautieria morchelliformis]